METSNHWLPLTEYALRNGMSISTLRRKIKANSIEFKMEEGRYLIKSDDIRPDRPLGGFVSSDSSPKSSGVASVATKVPGSRPEAGENISPQIEAERKISTSSELEVLREEIRQLQDDNLLRWKALEARVSGLAKKLELFSEQIAEAKMLVKIFEEKLDQRA